MPYENLPWTILHPFMNPGSKPPEQTSASGASLPRPGGIWDSIQPYVTSPGVTDFLNRQGQNMSRAGDWVSLGGTGLATAGAATLQPEIFAAGEAGMGVGSLFGNVGHGMVVLSNILSNDRYAAVRNSLGAGLGNVVPPTIDPQPPIDRTSRYFGF